MKDIVKIEFNKLAAFMDEREKFYRVIDEFVKKNGMKVPKQYEADWETWTRIERRRPWRTRPLIVRKMVRNARKFARMSRISK